MPHLRKERQSTRILFDKGFYQIKVELTVEKNNYVYIGSSKDELTRIPEDLLHQEGNLEEKIRTIGEMINPLNSTVLMDGIPYIPGSTLKGMIRFRLEHSLKPDTSGRLTSCFIKQGPPGPKDEIQHFLKKFGYWPNIPATRPNEKTGYDYKRKKMPDRFCKVCDLFGNQVIASRITFSDAKMADPTEPIIKKIRIRGNDIEKKVIPPKAQFIFTININNVSRDDLALLMLGMNLHNDGSLLMGMHKYSPAKNPNGHLLQFGRIKLEILEIIDIYNDQHGYDEAHLKDPVNIGEFIKDRCRYLQDNFGDQIRNFNETETEG